MGQSAKRHIGRILLDGGFLSHRGLNSALEEQKHSKELLGQVLIRMGVLKSGDVKVPLIVQEHLGTIDSAVKIAAGERQLLGELLVQSGCITNEQLDHVITEQLRSGERLGEVFTRLGILTERQLNALLDFQINQEAAHTSPLRLGELLVATGHISREHLDDALRLQTLSKKKIGEVLVEAGYVSPSSIHYGINLQKMCLSAVLAAILSLGMSTGSDAGDTCLFSKQLQTSPMREQYIAKVATESSTLLAYNTVTDNQVKSDASDDLSSTGYFFGKKSSTVNPGDTIDSFSRDCLSCHDGLVTDAVKVNYRNTPGHRTNKYDGKAEHPIGMDYSAYSAMDPTNYKPAPAFNSKMIFVNGRVGCLTCHNPLNPEKTHLVMSDYRSALCQTCHTK